VLLVGCDFFSGEDREGGRESSPKAIDKSLDETPGGKIKHLEQKTWGIKDIRPNEKAHRREKEDFRGGGGDGKGKLST